MTRLEMRLGVPLMHRTSRRLALTESGKGVLDRARRILSDGEAAEAEASAQGLTPRGTVRLAVPMSFGLRHVAPILPEFMAAFPQVHVDLDLSDALVDVVGADMTWCCASRGWRILAARPPPVQGPSTAGGQPRFFAGPWRAATSARSGRPPALLYSNLATPGVWRFSHVSQGDYIVTVEGCLCANNADALTPALLAGKGMALQPDFMVWEHLSTGALVEVLPEWRIPDIALHLVTPPGTLRPARVVALIDFLAKRLAGAEWAKE
jgi:DNA-binding transcriptional LysR family regulator